MKTHKKITTGFVVQDYEELPDGSFECVDQEFIAGDQVDYEDDMGEAVEVDTLKEIYCPFLMDQPKSVPNKDINTEMLEALKEADFAYTTAINATPTGNLRNKLTDMNILRLSAIDKADKD